MQSVASITCDRDTGDRWGSHLGRMQHYVSDRSKAFQKLLKDSLGVLMEERDACHEEARAFCTVCFVLSQI